MPVDRSHTWPTLITAFIGLSLIAIVPTFLFPRPKPSRPVIAEALTVRPIVSESHNYRELDRLRQCPWWWIDSIEPWENFQRSDSLPIGRGLKFRLLPGPPGQVAPAYDLIVLTSATNYWIFTQLKPKLALRFELLNNIQEDELGAPLLFWADPVVIPDPTCRKS